MLWEVMAVKILGLYSNGLALYRRLSFSILVRFIEASSIMWL